MIVRRAVIDDIEVLAELGRNFWVQTHLGQTVPYVVEDARDILTVCLEHDLLFVATHNNQTIGFIGGVSFPLMTNRSVKIGQETFWWVEPEHRSTGAGLKLLDTIEKAAKEQGLKYWSMLHLANINPVLMSKIYQRRGYTAAENTFTKEL